MKNPLVSDARLYQRFISPELPVRCRYYPTCSQYMIDAIHTHGNVKGTMMGVARVLRCHSFARGDTDYVLLKFRLTKNSDKTYYGPYTHRRNKETEVEKDG